MFVGNSKSNIDYFYIELTLMCVDVSKKLAIARSLNFQCILLLIGLENASSVFSSKHKILYILFQIQTNGYYYSFLCLFLFE